MEELTKKFTKDNFILLVLHRATSKQFEKWVDRIIADLCSGDECDKFHS